MFSKREKSVNLLFMVTYMIKRSQVGGFVVGGWRGLGSWLDVGQHGGAVVIVHLLLVSH